MAGGFIFKGSKIAYSSILKFSQNLGAGTTAFSITHNLYQGEVGEAALTGLTYGTYRFANYGLTRVAGVTSDDILGVQRFLYTTETFTNSIRPE